MRGGRGGDREAAIGGRGSEGETVGEVCGGLSEKRSAVSWRGGAEVDVFDLDPSWCRNWPTRRKHSAGMVLMGVGYSGALYTLLPVPGSDMTLDASCLQVGHTVVVMSLLIVPRSQISTHDL